MTEQIATSLVQARIPGFRKGSDIPAYTHSLRVRDILLAHGFDSETCIAGLLHDVIEDSDVTFDELKTLEFSDRVIALVDLCSHDETIKTGDARWMKMMARLVDANDVHAWAIKLADILDNVRSCGTMDPDRAWFIRNVKAKLVLALTVNVEGVKELREELQKEV